MTCPICASAPAAGYRPFCSRRCAEIDLGKWLTGQYVIASEPAAPDHDAEAGQAMRGPQ